MHAFDVRHRLPVSRDPTKSLLRIEIKSSKVACRGPSACFGTRFFVDKEQTAVSRLVLDHSDTLDDPFEVPG